MNWYFLLDGGHGGHGGHGHGGYHHGRFFKYFNL